MWITPVPTGCVRISGRDPSRAIHRDNVGYLPERPAFPSYQTPRKFLMHLARLIGVAGEPLKARVNICLEQCDIQKSADTKIEQMSKGGIQRLAMAQALLHNPDVLLMDEPMDGLDPLARENYTSHIRRLADGGKTIVLATHLLDGLELISDQLLVLHQGRCIFMGPPMFESELKAWLLERLRQGEGNGD